MAGDNVPLIEARHITKRFPGVLAVAGVDFNVSGGSCHVLLGENGAGKSTLVKVLSGVHEADEGELLVRGAPVNGWSPQAALHHGISTIYQEFTLIPNLSVAENIYLGHEPLRGDGVRRNRRELYRSARRLVDDFGFDIDPGAKIHSLGVAQRQMVEILKALSRSEESVLILDEPTAVLSGRETDALFGILRDLKSRGIGLVYVTHRLEEVARIGDQVSVMRDGKMVGSERADAISRRHIVQWMVGEEFEEFQREDLDPRAVGERRRALVVRNATALPHFEDITFGLEVGEVVCLFGLVGAGRTELLRAIYGADQRLDHGVVEVHGSVQHIPSPARAVRLGLGLAPEDRKRSGIVPQMSISDNIAIGSLDKLARNGLLLRRKDVVQVSRQLAGELLIRAPSLNAPVQTLSGGNQQKVVLGRLLAADADIILMDEPTRGVDVGARAEVYRLIFELAEKGKSVLVVTSDLDEVTRLRVRTLVMSEGHLSGQIQPADMTRSSVLDAALPGD